MDLAGLPEFTVVEISTMPGEGEIVIRGRFSHLRGVRKGRGWLYRGAQPPIIADLDARPSAPDTDCLVRSSDVERLPSLRVGDVFPWLDGYWRPYHIDMILAPADSWERRSYGAESARYFRLNGITGWQPADRALPDGAVELEVREGAWDHEHCEICSSKIGRGGEPEGYRNPADHWLCGECYVRYAVPHDLSFTVEI